MRTALSRIEAIGQQTLTELRGLLHRVGVPADAVREPQPSLERVDELVSSVRNAGIDVTVARHGSVRRRPLRSALAAYRIIQEALTNTIRHTPGSHARVDAGLRSDGARDHRRQRRADVRPDPGRRRQRAGRDASPCDRARRHDQRRTRARGGFRLIATVPLPTA